MARSDIEVTVAKLADGKLSIMLDNKEVHILSGKKDCTQDEIESMVQAVVDGVDSDW